MRAARLRARAGRAPGPVKRFLAPLRRFDPTSRRRQVVFFGAVHIGARCRGDAWRQVDDKGWLHGEELEKYAKDKGLVPRECASLRVFARSRLAHPICIDRE